MLVNLSIRDVVLIERLDLAFGPGLCALTGETGAGKSILLDALGLALGARSEAALIRRGATRAVVAAEFAPPPGHPAHALLAEHDLDGDERILLRRVVTADGRSRAFVNDQPVGVGLLREIGDALVEIQGQANRRGLLAPASHRRFLDSFSACEALAGEVAEARRCWRAAHGAHAEAAEALAEARRDEDYLRHVVAELDAIAPRRGEEATLAADRRALMAGERAAEAVRAARAEITDGRALDERLRAAQRHLARAAESGVAALAEADAALDRAAVEIVEAEAALAAAERALEPDPARLERIEERLFALRALARKHDADVDSLSEVHQALAARLAALELGDAETQRLAEAAEVARAAFVAAAERLSAARREAASALAARVNDELPPLRLGPARFAAQLEPLAPEAWTAEGAERVRFEVATQRGAAPGPLARIASGGELSRLLLALRVVLAHAGSAPTLIFDEVDSGIGGAAAAAVGARLARLGETLQVLVVTHAAQVAARAHRHYRVVKEETAAGTLARVEPLDPEARREELARMLAGARVTDAARAAADSLIGAGVG